MCSINWTKPRGHILLYKILSKRSHWAVKDEEPWPFYCKDTPNSYGGMRLLAGTLSGFFFLFCANDTIRLPETQALLHAY